MTTSVSDAELAQLIASLGATPPPPAPAEARCTVTELLADQCAHCRPTPPVDETESRLGPWINATYRGRCSGCGISFDEFTEIRADGDGGWLADCCGNVPETRQVDPLDGLIAAGEVRAVLAHNPDPVTCEVPPPAVPADRCTRADCPGNCQGWQHCVSAPTQMPAGPPPSTVKELRQVLIDFEASRPRSMQVALGPSELGTPCQQQMARKLAGAPRRPITDPTWAPFQGTAVHRSMEDVVEFWNRQLGRTRWLAEDRLVVAEPLGDLDGIAGHGDAFDLDYGMVVDWKHTGKTARDKLARAKRMGKPPAEQVSAEYRVQGHLYGYGHARKGRDVRYVRLVLLARSHDYDESQEWTEAYNPDIALVAIDRYWATHDLLIALDVAAQPDMVAAVPSAPSRDGCKWCPFLRPGQPSNWGGCPGDRPLDRIVARATDGLIAPITKETP